MKVTIANFGGIIPRYSQHHLSSISASIAHDVKLRNGRLEPWRELCDHAELAQSNTSFHSYGCCTLGWDAVVQHADVAVDWGRFYISGRTSRLEAVVVDGCCNPKYYNVGVPTPTQAPKASATEQCSRAADARAYVYTYVNQWYEESAPSPASNIIRVDDGSTVSVTGIALPPDGYGITHANVYRAASGFRQADGKLQSKLTDFLYVATVEFPSTTYRDNVRMNKLGTPLETEKVQPPAEGLQNITALGGVVRLAASKLNRIYLSENFQLHNWPVRNELTLDNTIIHMKASDQTLFVTTDAYPYIIDTSSCEDLSCTPVLKVNTALPDISCGHRSSAIMTPHGLVYSSPLGVILLNANGTWNILTKSWFTENDWNQVRPDTARFGYWEGFLFIITDTVSFMLDINGDPYGDMDGAELVTISDRPIDMETTNTGKLLLLTDGRVQTWDTGTVYREFIWESRELTGGPGGVGTGSLPMNGDPLGCMWSPASAKVRTKGTMFTLKHPFNENAYQRRVINEVPFRLPRVGRHMWFKVRLNGIEPVEFLDLGTAYFTVNHGA